MYRVRSRLDTLQSLINAGTLGLRTVLGSETRMVDEQGIVETRVMNPCASRAHAAWRHGFILTSNQPKPLAISYL